MKRFSKVLVANRGEIAVRILRGAGSQGYQTVAVFSEADRNALHASVADTAVCIGGAPVGESYMNVEALLQAARQTGADAIHPGYGFLAENAGFARACADAGLTFIGPTPEAIQLMGNKRAAKIAMREAGVPCVPGYDGGAQDDETLLKEIERIGFPVMIKAAAGGGGRGMRLVDADSDLVSELRSARSEALHGFGSDELILEKAIVRPRHVEIQVFGDTHGNCIHLAERDCSVQRRHQKVIEEAPSPAVDADLRQRMGDAAVLAAQSCQYVGAGTVEFLLAADGSFYFLEMNTRLQVEHPVTELITGVDLVSWQLRIAQGEVLPLAQEHVRLHGHAIEVRLYAEDPGQGFMPQTGTVLNWLPDEGAGLRIDAGIQPGQVVSPHYDPILCKLIAWGEDREEARLRLIRALDRSLALGVTTNRQFLRELLAHPEFASGAATTAFIDTEFVDNETLQPFAPEALDYVLAGILHASRHCGASFAPTGLRLPVAQRVLLAAGSDPVAVHLQLDAADASLLCARCGDTALELRFIDIAEQVLRFELQGVKYERRYAFAAGQVHLETAHGSTAFSLHTWDAPRIADAAGSGIVNAPMDGAVIAVEVEPGEVVAAGQVLVVMEAMKMEHTLRAGIDGTVQEVRAQRGDQVKGRQLLVTIEPVAEIAASG